eukprot:319428_1
MPVLTENRTINTQGLSGTGVSAGKLTGSPAVTTPITKQNFADIYHEDTPVGFRNELLVKLTYRTDEKSRWMFDRIILPFVKRCASPPEIVEIASCFGNTLLAVLHGMTYEEICDNWATAERSAKPLKPRRFPCRVTGLDISKPALDYTLRSGIAESTICGDLNTLPKTEPPSLAAE